MPAGMRLKSDGFASDLYDPDRRFTLRQYCQSHGTAYADYGLPVRLETFVSYALEFQRQFVPMLEPTPVLEVRKVRQSFNIRLESGEVVQSRVVVMATGITYCTYVPEVLAALPPELCTHSSAHHDLSSFRGRRVVVVGGGSSATDLAALLKVNGVSVQLVARNSVDFHRPPDNAARSVWKRITEPNLGLGPGFRSAIYTAVPGLFRLLPQAVRLRFVRRHLGPAGGWFMRDEVVGKVEINTGCEIAAAAVRNGSVVLQLREGSRSKEIQADHVIAATGYRPSIPRLTILDQSLRSALKLEAETPVLSSRFESSVPGLHFIGVTSANTFGPVMRFARGAEYTAVRLGAYLGSLCGQQSFETHAKTASP